MEMAIRPRIAFVCAVFALSFGCAPVATQPDENQSGAEAVNLKKATPVLVAPDVQACVDFWTRLGLPATTTVPTDNGLQFAILAAGDIELMYQSLESATADSPEAIEGVDRSILYVEVASLDEALAKLGDSPVVVAERATSYGAREIYVRDPAGNLIGFAEQAVAP